MFGSDLLCLALLLGERLSPLGLSLSICFLLQSRLSVSLCLGRRLLLDFSLPLLLLSQCDLSLGLLPQNGFGLLFGSLDFRQLLLTLHLEIVLLLLELLQGLALVLLLGQLGHVVHAFLCLGGYFFLCGRFFFPLGLLSELDLALLLSFLGRFQFSLNLLFLRVCELL